MLSNARGSRLESVAEVLEIVGQQLAEQSSLPRVEMLTPLAELEKSLAGEVVVPEVG